MVGGRKEKKNCEFISNLNAERNLVSFSMFKSSEFQCEEKERERKSQIIVQKWETNDEVHRFKDKKEGI